MISVLPPAPADPAAASGPVLSLAPLRLDRDTVIEAFTAMFRLPWAMDDAVRAAGPAGLAFQAVLPSTLLFEVRSDGRLAGVAGAINAVRGRHGDAQIAIWDRSALGRRNDNLVGRPILRVLFDALDLARLTAVVPVANVRGAAYARRLGFIAEGRMPRLFRFGGQWYDGLLYGILREEALAPPRDAPKEAG